LTNVRVGQLSKDHVSESVVSNHLISQAVAKSEINHVDIVINLKSDTPERIMPRASSTVAEGIVGFSSSSENKEKKAF